MRPGTRCIIRAALAADESVSPAERRRWDAALADAAPEGAALPPAISHGEAARLLGCSTRTVRRRVADGLIRRAAPVSRGAARGNWVDAESVRALSAAGFGGRAAR